MENYDKLLPVTEAPFLEGAELDLGQFIKDSKSAVTTKTFAGGTGNVTPSTYHGTHYQGYYSGKGKTEPTSGKGSVESFSEVKKTYGSGSKDRDAEAKKRRESKSGGTYYRGEYYGYDDDEDLYSGYWGK